MGIKNLTQILKKESPNSIKHINLSDFKNKKVAIDISILIYKNLINVRVNGDYLRNKDNEIISHVYGIYFKTINYLKLGITPIYIFDGKPPIEKKACIQNRINKVNSNKLKMESMNDKSEKLKIEKSTVRIKKEYINDLTKLFDLMGISYVMADGEAEACAAELCRKNIVQGVVSEDMDTLVYECPILIRNCIDKSIKKSGIITTFNYEQILKDLNLTKEQFIEFSILCGCDYCPTIPKIGSVNSLKIIRKYDSIDNYLKSNENKASDEFINKYLSAKRIFINDHFKNNHIEIISSNLQYELLFNYLTINCSMNKNKIINSLKILK